LIMFVELCGRSLVLNEHNEFDQGEVGSPAIPDRSILEQRCKKTPR
jgi:hypothetical protein